MSGTNNNDIIITRAPFRTTLPWREHRRMNGIAYNGMATIDDRELAMLLDVTTTAVRGAMMHVDLALVRDQRLWINVRGYNNSSKLPRVLVAHLRSTLAALEPYLPESKPARIFADNVACDSDAAPWRDACDQFTRASAARTTRDATKTTPATPELVHFFGAALPPPIAAAVAGTSNDNDNNNAGGADNRLLRKSDVDEMLRAHFAEQAKQLHISMLDAMMYTPELQADIEARAAELAHQRVDAFFENAAVGKERRVRTRDEVQDIQRFTAVGEAWKRARKGGDISK